MIRRDRLIKLTQKVISFNSENPPGNELALSKFIYDDMKSLGLAVKYHTYAKGRPNVIAVMKGSLPRKQAEKQALLLTPHFDTVPIGSGWKYDPLGGKIKNGKLYGRGATDDKGNLASAMEVMRSLIEDGFKPRKDIIMAATVDEETGSKFGIVPLVSEKVLQPGLALVLDSDECQTIIAQKGLIHIRVQVQGKKAHGAYNWEGVNAIEQAVEIIAKLKAYKFKYKKHPLLRPPTLNIGVIKGGDKVNMVADHCEFAVDLRYLPGTSPYTLLKEVRSIVQKVTKKFKIIIDDMQLPYQISPDHPFVKTYLNAAKACKCQAKVTGSQGATVMTFFQNEGIPAFATGYGAKQTAHTTDEYLKVETLYKGTKLLERFVKDYDAL
jgi:acetylornithine deacetylase/succinyl-diaminopimelate desuccinylase family protein